MNGGLRRGEDDGETVALAVAVLVEGHLRAMDPGDLAHDGEAPAAAFTAALAEPVEALEDALALPGRDARRVVAHRDAGARHRIDAHGDAPAAPRITDRVVQQVVEQVG